MPTLASALFSSITTSAISDKAAQFLTNIQSTFNRRNAIIRRVTTVSGHQFEEVFLTDPTSCSQCKGVLWGLWGQQCKPCKLVAHRKCLQAIDAVCVFDQSSPKLDLSTSHQIERKLFITTMCDHCGRVLTRWLEPVVGCSACSRNVHQNCKTAHFCPRPCVPRGETRQQDADTYKHQSRMSIEDFEIIRLLGAGSFSKVYLAKLNYDTHSEEFAIKVIKKTNRVLIGDPESLLTEWRALNLGRSYPFLTIAHCCFQSQDRFYFVMEYVIGQDLLYHIEKARKFSEPQAKFYSAEIVLALDYLHSQRIIYRDLKLDNVILDKTGHCKLLDFGMSKILDSQQMKTRTFCGTPNYISPEILRGDDYDYSTDWWSLGVLLYEMLFGLTPFEGNTEDEIYEAIKHKELEFPFSLSDRAQSILEGLLEKDPQRRLGCQLMEGLSRAIKQHPFFLFSVGDFELHQWAELECKQLKPPHVPTFDELDPNGEPERVEFTPIKSKELQGVLQSEFEKFSFYSDSFKDFT